MVHGCGCLLLECLEQWLQYMTCNTVACTPKYAMLCFTARCKEILTAALPFKKPHTHGHKHGGMSPVGIPDQALQVMEVHEAKLADWWLQVEVDDVLPADPFQVLAVAHPRQMVDDLLIPWNLEAIPEGEGTL